MGRKIMKFLTNTRQHIRTGFNTGVDLNMVAPIGCKARLAARLLFLGLVFSAVIFIPLNVYAVGSGDGNILRRTNQGENTCGGPTNACHNYQVHNSTNTVSTKWQAEGYAGWGITDDSTSRYGKFVCQTCHTPHNTDNIFLIKEKIKSPNPLEPLPAESGPTQGEVDYRYRSATGDDPTLYPEADYVLGNDRVDTDGISPDTSASGRPTASTRICEVCHSKTDHHRYDTTAQTDGRTHNNAKQCTTCHYHNVGFKKPSGGTADNCELCHGTEIYARMDGVGDTSNYFMYLTNTDYQNYPTQDVFGSGDISSTNRKCIMCHAKMLDFFDDLTDGSGDDPNKWSAKNLRRSILEVPGTDGTQFSDTEFIESMASDPIIRGGICTSCHINEQYRNNLQKASGTTQTPIIDPVLFKNSPHNYQVQSKQFTDGSSFYANCLKCHNEYPENTASKMNTGIGPVFAPHSSTERSLHAPMATPMADPLEEDFCYNCHGNAAATMDYYGETYGPTYGTSIVNKNAVKIKDVFTSPLTISKHDIADATRIGKHKADEGVNPSAGWLTSGSNLHVECADCHNPHAQNKSGETYGKVGTGSSNTVIDDAGDLLTGGTKTWTTDQWRGYVLEIKDGTNAVGEERMIVSNTATSLTVGAAFSAIPSTNAYYTVKPTGHMTKGNSLRGPNNGIWGVDIDYGTTAPSIGNYSNPTFTKNTSLSTSTDKIYELCFKCHSDYGWGTGVTTEFNIPDATTNTIGTYATGESTNIAKEFNPNNVGHHPVVENGENQPIKTLGSSETVIGTGFTVSGIITEDAKAYTLAGITVSGSPWTTNQHAGKCIQMTSGSAINEIRIITRNTVNQIYIDPKFSVNPANGNTFAIKECSIFNVGADFANGSANPGVATPWPRFTNGSISTIIGDPVYNVEISGLAGGGIPSSVIPGWYIYIGSLVSTANTTNTPALNSKGASIAKCSTTALCPPMLATSGWFQVTKIQPGAVSTVKLLIDPQPTVTYTNSAYALTAGLGNAFVPPYGPWSTIACTDCHESANPNDPAGPHGSASKWILRQLEAQSFKWYYGGAYAPGSTTLSATNNATNETTISYPDGSGGWGSKGAADAQMPNYFCLNCHRADVYGSEDRSPKDHGVPAVAGFTNFEFRFLSRLAHVPDTGGGHPSNSSSGDGYNTYGIMCMNCHGGDARANVGGTGVQPANEALGGIHGSNLGRGKISTEATAGTSYRGRRLLNGAVWVAVTRSSTYVAGTCWTKSGAGFGSPVGTDGISSCGQGHAGNVDMQIANYPYYSGGDE